MCVYMYCMCVCVCLRLLINKVLTFIGVIFEHLHPLQFQNGAHCPPLQSSMHESCPQYKASGGVVKKNKKNLDPPVSKTPMNDWKWVKKMISYLFQSLKFQGKAMRSRKN